MCMHGERPEEGVKSPAAGALVVVSHAWVLGTAPGLPNCKIVSTANQGATSLAP